MRAGGRDRGRGAGGRGQAWGMGQDRGRKGAGAGDRAAMGSYIGASLGTGTRIAARLKRVQNTVHP